MKGYRDWTAKQSYLMPPSPSEWLPPGHLAYFMLDVVETLDISEIERAVQAKDWRGERPYPPRLMVAIMLYGYAIGIVSSRRLARATYEDVAFRVIVGEAHPSFTTINQFRLDHLGAFRKLFAEVLRLCRRAGLVSLGHVALDGSKIKANASKHKAMSYDRMQQSETRIQQEVDDPPHGNHLRRHSGLRDCRRWLLLRSQHPSCRTRRLRSVTSPSIGDADRRMDKGHGSCPRRPRAITCEPSSRPRRGKQSTPGGSARSNPCSVRSKKLVDSDDSRYVAASRPPRNGPSSASLTTC